MRFFVLAMPLAAALTLTTPASAESLLDGRRAPPSSDRAVRSALPEDVGKALDADFAALAAAASPAEARGPERRILAALSRSGSATADLLMAWADEAVVSKNYAAALDLLDQVIVLAPRFAEAYNRRATIHYATDDYRRSLDDIRTTLALEPRHFGALSGLAAILRELGDRERSLEVYDRILALHPTLESAKAEAARLRAAAEGSPI